MFFRGFSNKRTVPGFVTALVIATVLISGCSSLEPDPHSAPSASPERGELTESEWQAAQFPEMYDQQIQWQHCDEDDGFDEVAQDDLETAGYGRDQVACGVVIAPIDWDDPSNTDTIELRFSWIQALSGEPKIGSLFINPGGPGVTATDQALSLAISADFAPVAERYDLVGLDPRGVGGSSPINCSLEYTGEITTGLSQCIAENALTHTMGTVQVARDHELLRHLMGDEQIHYFGVSYGTMLGGSYATLFPERVGRMVLDSAENSEWASSIHAFDQAVAISDAVVEVGLSCTTDLELMTEACPFTDEATLIEIIHEFNQEPLVSTDGQTMNGIDLGNYLKAVPFEWPEEQAASLDLLTLALYGDEDATDELVANSAEPVTDLVMEVITCHEKPAQENWEQFRAHATQVGIPVMLGGPEVTDELLHTLSAHGCDQLPERGQDFIEAYRAPTAAPVLVFGITGDPATPYQYAQQFAAELGNATLVTVEGWGHAAAYTQFSSCADTLATAYLLDGVLPAAGTECVENE